ncbi:nucleolar and coiled-body phosphoprotein 1, partial [Biomphalaria glabrata]
FKSHKVAPLAGARSLSEDSVFSTEARESINRFPTTAASAENIPRTSSAFQ